MQFKVTTEGPSKLGLAEALEQFANEQWIANHMTLEQAVEFVLDQFRRTVASELQMMQIECAEGLKQAN